MPPVSEVSWPTRSARPAARSDSLEDLHVGVDRLLDFVGESLILAHQGRALSTKLPSQLQPALSLRVALPSQRALYPAVELTTTSLPERSWFPKVLFQTTLPALLLQYRAYLSEICLEAHHVDGRLCSEDAERAEEERAKLALRLDEASYEEACTILQRTLEIDVHTAGAPLSMLEVRRLLAIQRKAQHSSAPSAEAFLARLGRAQERPVSSRSFAVRVDFEWLYGMAEDLLQQAAFVDEAVRGRWSTRLRED